MQRKINNLTFLGPSFVSIYNYIAMKCVHLRRNKFLDFHAHIFHKNTNQKNRGKMHFSLAGGYAGELW